MVSVRWHKLVASVLSACALVGLSLVGFAQPASAITCDSTYTGEGSQVDPWVVSTKNELSCFVSGISPTPAGGADAYIVQGADITWDNLSQLDPGGAVPFHYDGGGHTVTVENVSSFVGLFAPTLSDEIRNLHISALNTSLSPSAGWFTRDDHSGIFTNVSSDGDIAAGGGGIIGQANGTTISNAYSTGAIDVFAGGIIGQLSENVTITNAYSTGAIMRDAGGITGQGTIGITVISAYSLGTIDRFAGGIIGPYSDSPMVSNVYSAGTIEPLGGGLLGALTSPAVVTNSYSVYGPLWADMSGVITASNVFEGNGTFTAADARAYLSPLNAWAECSLVNPVGFYLVAITPVNPCEVQPTPMPTPIPTPEAELASTSAFQGGNEVVAFSFAGAGALLIGVAFAVMRRRLIRR